jgi:hypothetical protein
LRWWQPSADPLVKAAPESRLTEVRHEQANPP